MISLSRHGVVALSATWMVSQTLGSLIGRRRPGEHAGAGIDRRAGRDEVDEREGDRLAGVGVRRRRGEGQELPFRHRLVANRGEHGHWFSPPTSLTVIMRVSKSLQAGSALSVTRTTTVCVPGPCSSVGVNVKDAGARVD
jgi:hypothetical protein